MAHKHCYLFALEVSPLKVGGIYNELPLHCTLMHRFCTELEASVLASKVHDLFSHAQPIELIVHKRSLLGPKQVAVSEIVPTPGLLDVHTRLHDLLIGLEAEYTAPEWVGEGYRAHVTEREHAMLEVGAHHLSKAVYLIEVKVPGHDHQRLIRAKFNLGNGV